MKNVAFRLVAIASTVGCLLSGAATSLAAPDPVSSAIWNVDAQLMAQGSSDGDFVGNAVAIDGDTILVGAQFTATNIMSLTGAAYVFVRSGNTWVQPAKLQGKDTAPDDSFGETVAIVGDTAIVGAPGVDGFGPYSGGVYVFVRNGTTWVEQTKLVPSLGVQDSAFGTSIAFDGNTIVVGAPGFSAPPKNGLVYVFERSVDTWVETSVLMVGGMAAGNDFGRSVALSGNRLLVGAPGTDTNGTDSGAVYVFERNGSAWTEEAQLTSPNVVPNGSFGHSIASSGTTALIGELQPLGKPLNSGVVYAFEYDGTNWLAQETLEASDGVMDDYFGARTAVIGNMAVVGARFADVEKENTGAAYVFMHDASTWSLLEKVVQPKPEAHTYFSAGVALSNEWMVIGQPGHGETLSPGTAYVFQEQLLAAGKACSQSGECANGFSCVDGVCCNSACGGGAFTDCLACSMAAGAAVDGMCGPAAMGTVCRFSVGVCDAKEVCDGIAADCPSDAQVPGCMDSDFDGLSDSDEILFGTNPFNSDSDGDGVIDGAEAEWNVDTDKDNLINALDNDSDNDGLPDGLETDPQGTKPLDPDSDDDCALDGVEDANRNGMLDPDETDPMVRDYEGFCCTKDIDCGTETSGQICAYASRCAPGCRGTLGNGCPDGTICTSVNDTPGDCVDAEMGEGGNGGAGGSGGFDVTVNPNGCNCRTTIPEETPGGSFALVACAAIAAWHRNRRKPSFASAANGARTRVPRGGQP